MTLDTAQDIIIILATALAAAIVLFIASIKWHLKDVKEFQNTINDLDKRYIEDSEVWQQAFANVKQDRDIMLAFWSYHYDNIIEKINGDYPEVPTKKANNRYKAIVSEIQKLIDKQELTLEQTRTLAHVLLPIGLLNHQIEKEADAIEF